MKTVLLSLLLVGASAQAQSLKDLDAHFSRGQSVVEAELFAKLVTQISQKYGDKVAADMVKLVKDEKGTVRYVMGTHMVCNVVTVYYTQLGIDRCLLKAQAQLPTQ